MNAQTQADTHLRASNNKNARPQPTMGQVHLVEVVDSLNPERETDDKGIEEEPQEWG